MIANVNQGLVDIVKSEVTMAAKIRAALQNFGFRVGDIFSYGDVKSLFKDLANAGAFDGFEDKYGEGKTDKDIYEYIRHNFHGVVDVENKKGIEGLIEKIEDGRYKYLGQGPVDRVKAETTMASKIRAALQNFGFKAGDIFSYSDVEVFLKDLADAGAFDGFEDKYGEGRMHDNIYDYIRHNFHGVVDAEGKKETGGLIERIGAGEYKYLG